MRTSKFLTDRVPLTLWFQNVEIDGLRVFNPIFSNTHFQWIQQTATWIMEFDALMKMARQYCKRPDVMARKVLLKANIRESIQRAPFEYIVCANRDPTKLFDKMYPDNALEPRNGGFREIVAVYATATHAREQYRSVVRVQWKIIKAAVVFLGLQMRAARTANDPVRKRLRGEFDADV